MEPVKFFGNVRIAKILANAITHGSLIGDNQSRALGVIEKYADATTATAFAEALAKGYLTGDNQSRALGVIEKYADATTATAFVHLIANGRLSGDRERVLKVIEQHADATIATALAEALNGRLSGDRERVLKVIEQHADAAAATALVKAIAYGYLTGDNQSRALGVIEKYADAAAATALVKAIAYGYLTGDNQSRALGVIEKYADATTATALAEALAKGNLTGENLKRALGVIEQHADATIATALAQALAKGSLTGENLKRARKVFEQHADADTIITARDLYNGDGSTFFIDFLLQFLKQNDSANDYFANAENSFFVKILKIAYQNQKATKFIFSDVILRNFEEFLTYYAKQAESNQSLESIIIDFVLQKGDLPALASLLSNGNIRAKHYLGLATSRNSGEVILKNIINQSIEKGSFSQQLFMENLIKTISVLEDPKKSFFEKKALFFDNYSLADSLDPIFNLRVNNLIAQGNDAQLALVSVLEEDFDKLMLQSAGKEFERYLSDKLRTANLTDEEAELIRQNISQMRKTRREADLRNRQRYQQYLDEKDNDQLLAELIVPHTSISQVGPSAVTLPILETAAFSDALLGQAAYKQEFNLMSHVSMTSKTDLDTVRGRLPSLGNPHGVNVNRVYRTENLLSSPMGEQLMMGSAHKLVNIGLPSSEIISIVVNSTSDLYDQKIQVARGGWYIPIFDLEGKILFSPEEFDEMRAVFYPLDQARYPESVMMKVWQTYQALKNDHADQQKAKKWEFLSKAIESIEDELNETDATTIDLAVLISFIENNDLNTHSLSWYQKTNFREMFHAIQKNTNKKIFTRLREIFYNYEQQQLRFNSFINSFQNKQLPYIHSSLEALQTNLNIFNSLVKNISFGFLADATRAIDKENYETNIAEIKKLAKYMSQSNRALIARIWENSFTNLRESRQIDEETLDLYQKILIPIITGSGGREEITLGSDLDYEILVDDENLPLRAGQSKEAFLQELKNFVNNNLALAINQTLKDQGIRADAGLGKLDGQPFELLSDIRIFQLEIGGRRQKVEPTEVMVFSPVYDKDQELINKAKRYLFENPSSIEFSDYVDNDLIFRSQNSFSKEFEDLYAQLASNQDVEHIKNSMQRVLNFKLFSLVFQAHQLGYLSSEELSVMPSSTWELIVFLKENGIINQHEAEVCEELLAVSYRLRFISEINSEEAKTADLLKVQNHKFKLENLSYLERKNLFELLKEFKYQILPITAYKP